MRQAGGRFSKGFPCGRGRSIESAGTRSTESVGILDTTLDLIEPLAGLVAGESAPLLLELVSGQTFGKVEDGGTELPGFEASGDPFTELLGVGGAASRLSCEGNASSIGCQVSKGKPRSSWGGVQPFLGDAQGIGLSRADGDRETSARPKMTREILAALKRDSGPKCLATFTITERELIVE